MDRRVIWAVALMMLIALAPTFFLKKPVERGAGGLADTTAVAPTPPAAPAGGQRADSATAPILGAAPSDSAGAAPAPARPAETITVRAPLYTYVLSTQGGRLVSATLNDYRSMVPGDSAPAQIVKPESELLAFRLIAAGDTIPIDRWVLTPSARSVTVGDAPASLTLTGAEGAVSVELTYTFMPDYRIGVSGRVTGVGPDGGLALVDLGRGLRNTEIDSSQNFGA